MDIKCEVTFDVNSERCSNCEHLLDCSETFFDLLEAIVNAN